jgi:GAF domain-containing protein
LTRTVDAKRFRVPEIGAGGCLCRGGGGVAVTFVSAAMSPHVRSEVEQFADLLLDDVERIAERSVSRMQELLPSYAKLPAERLTPLALTSTRNLLEAVRDPDVDPIRAEDPFRVLGETRLSQGIAADDMLEGWRILLKVVREQARPVANRLGVGDDVLLDFVEATLRWGDRGMRMSAAAYREAEIGELERLAAEQAALRRVAMMVARGASPGEVFAKVTEELSCLLGVDLMVRTVRFEPDGTATILAAQGLPKDLLSPGTNTPRTGGGVLDQVFLTGRPGRVDDYVPVTGQLSVSLREAGICSGAAGPIVVDGRTWGAMAVASPRTLPSGIEDRVAQFAELVSTAISNVQAQGEVERLLDEQAALRRVATLVAQDVASEEMFGAVAGEVGVLFGADYTGMIRYEPDPSFVTTIATWAAIGEHPSAPPRFRTAPGDPTAMVADAGKPARVDDWTNVPGPIAQFIRRELGVKSSVGSPIVVNGGLWGALAVHSKRGPLAPDTESRLLSFTELVATAIANTSTRAEVSRLAEEQAALRRVATLVAEGNSPSTVLDAVAAETERALGADGAMLLRYEPDDEVTVVACIPNEPGLPPGMRISHKGYTVSAMVRRSGRPARIADYGQARGPLADAARAVEWKNGAVGTPITVDARLWGVIIANWRGEGSPPADAEERMAKFAALLATAIANADSNEALRRLADEQAALRRVATLVAGGAPPTAVFDAVVTEMERLLRARAATLIRYESADDVTFLAHRGPGGQYIPLGTRASHTDGESATALVRRTKRPARHMHAEGAPGSLAAIARDMGFRSSVGVPLVVEGNLWGCIVASWGSDVAPPIGTEERMARFGQLLATAIANADSGEALRRLADQQAALRRVATLVAREASQAEVFTAIAQEIGQVLDADEMWMIRYERDIEAVEVAAAGPHRDLFPVGVRWPLGGENVASRVFRTGKPSRMDDYRIGSGAIAEALRSMGVRGVVGTPILVRGQLWGTMQAGTFADKPLAPDTQSHLGQFTELMATAIANAEARAEVRRLADEQAALRRVATLVAEGAPPMAVFEAVTFETLALMGADSTRLLRYEPDGTATFLAERNAADKPVRVGTRVTLEGDSVAARVLVTQRSCRINGLREATGAMAALARERGERAAVGAPIMVEGRLWGVIVAMWSRSDPPPQEAAARINEFAQLAATTMANADSRDQLTASRARLVTEADDARRRVVRDLHDGAQQRLLQTIVTLKLVQRALEPHHDKADALIAEALAHAQQGNTELRELAHGILPAVLIQGGLRGGVRSIVSRLDLPVEIDVPGERFPAEVEASAYFVVAEALTNVVKHARAERAEVRASTEDGMLRVEVRDDGVGAADPSGHGLVGLADRVTAIGGQLVVESPEGGGTLLAAKLPVLAS